VIHISSEEKGDNIVFSVKDNGNRNWRLIGKTSKDGIETADLNSRFSKDLI